MGTLELKSVLHKIVDRIENFFEVRQDSKKKSG